MIEIRLPLIEILRSIAFDLGSINEIEKEIEKEMLLYVKAIMNSLPASDSMLQKLRTETEKDEVLKEVSEYICEGWPKSSNHCSKNSLPYWEHRSSLKGFRHKK